MEQQQFKVKFSLGTKLVLSLTLLFILVVGFLATSAVRLVIDDKKDYVQSLQLMEATVAGKEFSEKTRLALDNLRLFLTSFDPRQPVTPAQSESLRNLVKNQQEASAVTAYLVKPDGSARYLTGFESPGLNSTHLVAANLQPAPAFFSTLLPRVTKDGFAFIAYRVPPLPPMLVVAFADLSLKDYAEGMPVALSWLDLARLQITKRTSELRIANADGTLLYSTDVKELKEGASLAGHVLLQAAASSNLQSGMKIYELPGRQNPAEPEKFVGTYQKGAAGTVILAQMPWKTLMSAASKMGERLALLGILSLGGAILFAIFFSTSITRPLKALHRATALVAKGDFSIDPKVKTRDEVGQLSFAFVAMSKKIQELLIETVKKAHLDEELKVAAAVQESLIPPPEYRDDQIELIGHYQAAAECGGDWWGFFRIGDKVCIMIADATGHGVPSALITASARSCFSVIHKLAKEKTFFRLNPGEMMSYANKVIFDAATTKIMMTFFIGVLDLEARTLTYANAGHNPPWLFKSDGAGGFKMNSLMPKGPRLGEREESGDFEETTIAMDTGDILFLYTDGLIENKNTAGEQYGKKRVRKVIEAALARGPKGMVATTVDSYVKFNEGKAALDDDVTLAVMRILS